MYLEACTALTGEADERSARGALLRGLGGGLGELHDVAEVRRRVPALALDGDVVGDGAGLDLAHHAAVVVGGVPALHAEPAVRHLVRVVRRVDPVLVTVLVLAVLHGADRDGLGVEALLGTEVPVDLPHDAEHDRNGDQEPEDRSQGARPAAVVRVRHCFSFRLRRLPWRVVECQTILIYLTYNVNRWRDDCAVY